MNKITVWMKTQIRSMFGEPITVWDIVAAMVVGLLVGYGFAVNQILHDLSDFCQALVEVVR